MALVVSWPRGGGVGWGRGGGGRGGAGSGCVRWVRARARARLAGLACDHVVSLLLSSFLVTDFPSISACPAVCLPGVNASAPMPRVDVSCSPFPCMAP